MNLTHYFAKNRSLKMYQNLWQNNVIIQGVSKKKKHYREFNKFYSRQKYWRDVGALRLATLQYVILHVQNSN